MHDEEAPDRDAEGRRRPTRTLYAPVTGLPATDLAEVIGLGDQGDEETGRAARPGTFAPKHPWSDLGGAA